MLGLLEGWEWQELWSEECPWAKLEKPVIRGSDIIDGQKAAGSKFFFLPIAVTHVPNVRKEQTV